MTWKLLSPADHPGGVAHYTRPDGNGSLDILSVQDTAPAIEMAKAMRTHNDGYNADRTFRRVAIIPPILEQKWREEGWYPHDKRELARRLNSSDWSHLRTADGRLGVTNGALR